MPQTNIVHWIFLPKKKNTGRVQGLTSVFLCAVMRCLAELTLSLLRRDRMRSISWATASEFFSFSSRASWRCSHSHAPENKKTQKKTYTSTVTPFGSIRVRFWEKHRSQFGTGLWLPTCFQHRTLYFLLQSKLFINCTFLCNLGW